MSATSIELRDFQFQGNGNKPPTNWRKGNQIGCGGFSNVYKAEIDMQGQTHAIAVKVIKVSQNEKDTKKKKSVVAEIKALKKFQHERIVSYYGFLELEFKSFIFMEYIEEGSLRKYMSTNGRLNIDMIKHFTRQILQGVQYLHGLKCVHRDIKPENVLIKSKNIKLTDFGLAKFFEEISKTYTAFTGTIRYMAPEVFEKGKSNSKSVDIWATGCVVLEMTTGDIPFSKIDQLPLQGLMSRDSLSPLDKQYLDAELPKETENFLSKIFTFDAKKRPTASILLKDTFLNVLMKEHKGTQTSADCADGNSQIISSEDIEEPSTSSNNESIGSQKKVEEGDFPKQIKHKFTQTIDSHAATKRKLTNDEPSTSTASITKTELLDKDVKRRKTPTKPSNENSCKSSKTEYNCCSEFKKKVLKKHQGKNTCMTKWPIVKKKVLNEDYLVKEYEPEFTSPPTSNRAFFSLACKKFITLTCGNRSQEKDPPKCVLDAIYGKFPCPKNKN